MKLAYLDCASGISGDMTLAALIDAGADLAAIQAGIDSLGLAGVAGLSPAEVKRQGFRACRSRSSIRPNTSTGICTISRAMIDQRPVDRSGQGFGPANLRSAGRSRSQSSRHHDREGSFSRGRSGRFDRRHRGRGDRLRPAGDRAVCRFGDSHRAWLRHHRPWPMQHPGPRHGRIAP